MKIKIVFGALLTVVSIFAKADGPVCEKLLTLEDITKHCGTSDLKYKVSPMENGKADLYCVRQIRKSFANQMILNVLHYEDETRATGYANSLKSKNKKFTTLDFADNAVKNHTSHKVLGERSMIRFQVNKTFIELKYQHGKREKAFCKMDNLVELAKVIHTRVKQ